ncbi:MAG: ATP synthase subunit I [Desulfobacterales bacterium]|nr:ATP synthase subunit I [Desulfobacterales bacterium]
MAMRDGTEINSFPLSRVEAGNWLLLVGMTMVALLCFTRFFAQGVVVGGLIANLSFIILKRDLFGIMAGPLKIAKLRFFIKYYARLTVLALILFFLVRYELVGVLGLLVGLSTVVLSILCTAAIMATKFYSTSKEAA